MLYWSVTKLQQNMEKSDAYGTIITLLYPTHYCFVIGWWKLCCEKPFPLTTTFSCTCVLFHRFFWYLQFVIWQFLCPLAFSACLYNRSASRDPRKACSRDFLIWKERWGRRKKKEEGIFLKLNNTSRPETKLAT